MDTLITYTVPPTTTPIDLNKFSEFVASRHLHQKRKNGEPYFNHCSNVSAIAATIAVECGVPSESVPIIVAAALGHDLIEDTATDFEDIEKRSSAEVAALISWVSDDKRIPVKYRHERYVSRLHAAPLFAQIVKLADLADNVHDSFELIGTRSEFIIKWQAQALLELTCLYRLSNTQTYKYIFTRLEELKNKVLVPG